MSVLVEILQFVQDGEAVPDEVFRRLNDEEQAALRKFETVRREDQHWREITLSILRTATDLTRGQDRMLVLEELVQSSRRIIRSDIAYISLNNPDLGRTSVLTTAGVVTEKFRRIEMPLGVGILGLVASTRQAAWTSDHAKDPNVTHVPDVDDAVKGEGIRAILGAPLVIGGEIIGALMVGERRPRSYTIDEVLVLDSLASLAAVALETSQLIEDLEANIEALRQANVDTALKVEQLERLSNADAGFMGVLARGTRTKDLDLILRDIFQADVWFWRNDEPYPVSKGEVVSISSEQEAEMRELIAQSRESGDLATSEKFSVLALSVNQRRLTAICVGGPVDATQERILYRASQTFATIILFREALHEAENRQISDLLRKVVEGVVAEEDIARVKKLTGIDLRERDNFHLVSIKASGDLPSARTIDRLLGEQGTVFEHSDHLCALVAAQNGIDSVLGVVCEWADQHGSRIYIGAVPLPESENEVQSAHSAASSLAGSMHSLGLDGQIATPSLFGSLGLLLDSQQLLVDRIITDGIGQLINYDSRHGTDLASTAAKYFDNGRSVGATAKALYVHENTVRQRLDRITGILGPSWNSGPQAFDTHLALRAWQVFGHS